MSTPAQPSDQPYTGHVRWRRVLLILMTPVLAIAGIGHVLGAGGMELAGLATAGAVTAGVVAYPRIRRHFDWRHHHERPQQQGQRGYSKRWTANWQRSRSSKSPLGTMGSRRHRSGTGPFRRRSGAGLRPGGRGRGSPGTGRRRGAAFRSPGTGRRRSGTGSRSRGFGRRASGRVRSPFGRSRGGAGRSRGALGKGRGGLGRSRRGSGRSRGGSPKFSPFRRGSRASGSARRGTGTGSRRRFSPFRPHTRGTGRRRLGGPRTGGGTGARRRFSPFRPSSWRSRGRHAGSSRPGGRRHAGSGGRPARRFSPFRPGTWTRRGRAARPGGTPPRTRRRIFRPSTWRRPRTGTGGPGGGPRRSPGGWRRFVPFARRRMGPRRATGAPPRGRIRRAMGTAARRARHPFSWRRRTGTPSPRTPGRFRRAWWRVAGSPGSRGSHGPGPARYAWWRLRGSPGVPGSRGTRRRAMRARYRAWRARLRGDPDLARYRPWYAPWRLIPGSRHPHRFRALRNRWRRSRWSRSWRRRLVVPRGRDGRPLSRWQRAVRRWRIWRGHTPGVIRLRRPVRWRTRLNPRNWGWVRRRRLRPPRHWRFVPGFVNRRRVSRYMRRRGAPGRMAIPRPGPAPAVAPAGGFTSRSRARGRRTHVGSRIQSVTDQIHQLGAWDPDGPDDLHETISTLSGISEASGTAYQRIAGTLREHGVHTGFPDALEEASGKIGHEADQLKGKLDKGLMDRADGATSSRVQGVADEIHELGGWQPGGPVDLHETMQELGGFLDGVRGAYNRIGDTISQTGAHESYPPALSESADALGAIGDEVESAFANGVMTPPR